VGVVGRVGKGCSDSWQHRSLALQGDNQDRFWWSGSSQECTDIFDAKALEQQAHID
jgi:hypothetical protein